jgi:hypothetical protein
VTLISKIATEGCGMKQYGFDVKKNVLASILSSPHAPQSDFLAMAASVGNDGTLEIVRHIFGNSPNPRTRLAALNCAVQLNLHESLDLIETACNDTHLIVRDTAKKLSLDLLET